MKEVCEKCRPLFEELMGMLHEQAIEITKLREENKFLRKEIEEIKGKLKEKQKKERPLKKNYRIGLT